MTFVYDPLRGYVDPATGHLLGDPAPGAGFTNVGGAAGLPQAPQIAVAASKMGLNPAALIASALQRIRGGESAASVTSSILLGEQRWEDSQRQQAWARGPLSPQDLQVVEYAARNPTTSSVPLAYAAAPSSLGKWLLVGGILVGAALLFRRA
ncbi:MAG: hypothetical protein ABR586_01315 [Thermoplasmatota archaeon]